MTAATRAGRAARRAVFCFLCQESVSMGESVCLVRVLGSLLSPRARARARPGRQRPLRLTSTGVDAGRDGGLGQSDGHGGEKGVWWSRERRGKVWEETVSSVRHNRTTPRSLGRTALSLSPSLPPEEGEISPSSLSPACLIFAGLKNDQKHAWLQS